MHPPIRTSTAIALVTALQLASGSASYAQQAEPREFVAIDEIVVTARRQSESLQNVPATVSVLTESDIENTGVRVASEFVQLTPGVTIVAGNVEAADTQINIRGLNGARDAENNVALVVDGILKTNTSSLNQDQGAITQIEVLKGPQGALYGRNAAAGAIVLTTKKPGDVWETSGRASYGSNETFRGAALISGPVGDNLGIVINGDFARSDGFFRNSFLDTDLNRQVYPNGSTDRTSIDNYRIWNLNGRLVWSPDSETEIDAKIRYGEHKSGAISFNAAFQVPFLAEILDPTFNIDVNDHEFIFKPNVDPLNEQETFEASIRFETNIGFADLVGYAAYNKINNFFYADGTSGTFEFFSNEPNCVATLAALTGLEVQAPFGIGGGAFLPPYSPTTCDGTQYQQRDQEDYSAELRLVGENGPLSWQVGAYFLHIDRRVCLNLGLDTGQGVVEECFTTDPRNPTEALADDTFDTDVYAAFGSADYAFDNGLNLGLALRYDIEKRKVSNNVPTDARTRWVGNVLTGFPNGTVGTPANYFLNPGLDPAYNPSGVLPDRSETFKQIQPKISVSYVASDELTLFGNWGIGFKSGGFNNSGSQAIIDGLFNDVIGAGLSIFDVYNKERTSAFEAGIKGRTLDGRVRYELAGYYTTVKDMQFFEFFVGPFGLLRVVSNMDKVRLYGVEASVNARVTDWLSVYAAGNVTDSKIKENSARPNTVGNKSPYTADYTLNVGAEVLAPIVDSLDFLIRADYRLTGPTWFHTVQDNSVPNIFGLEGNFANSKRDSYGVMNLRAGIKHENWSIIAYSNNLFDKEYLMEVIPAPEFGGDFIAPAGDREFGLELSAKF
ncbi:MAG: TonB-dependent receptor [Alphaproteobacteria bacterium]|nr:MAG: TonB-dependent receptor [Alphaproteobacteria bacterium]